MASGLLIKQKQLLAGDGITIEHAQTSSTISLSSSTLNAAVRIYDATIASDTGVVTITDGTPVADLNIGDEIRTPDGVYQKVKDGITTGSIPDDGSHILVSGCTDPTAVNGMYVATGEPNTWKNETGNYWISKLDGYGGPWWFIASSQAPANPGASSIHYRAIAATAQNPWDANFTPSHASGTISVQKYSDLVSKTDTIDLFEHASTSVASADIVQSVNGNKPDASGNVTIETGSSVDESRLLPKVSSNGDIPIRADNAWTASNLDNIINGKINTHNNAENAHPMQGATTNDYNGLDTNCSWYLSYGDNTSNVNAPANGPFFVMTKKWTNSTGTAGAGMQIAIRNMTGNLVNQSVYIRTWSMSSGWRTWQKVGSSAMVGTPDYGAGVDITSTLQQGVYAAPSAGWIYATANGVSISGNLIGNVTQIVLPVAAGDTITADVVTIAKFYPNR